MERREKSQKGVLKQKRGSLCMLPELILLAILKENEKRPQNKKREKKAVEKHKEERKKTTRRNRGKSECKAKGRPPKAKKETKAEALKTNRKSFVVQHSKKLAYKKPSHKVTDRKSFLMNPKGRKSMTKVNIRINKQLLKQRVEKLINKNTEQTGNRKPRKKNIDKETGMQVEIERNSTVNKAEKAEMLKGPDDSRNSGDHHDTSSTEKDEETADLKSLTSTIAQFINMISVDSTPVTKTIQISKSIVSLLGKSNYSSFIEPNSYVLPVINGLPPEGKYEVVVRPIDDRKKEFKAHNVSVVKNKDREEFTCMLWYKN